ncbi:hypothetical protein [Haloquadratum walsbyi]|uniref:DUF7509 family protein n=1 Tax=Haloquadratum walsbyi TaxID=293091 RepID=UPI0026F014CE|nr:hypothetical protein [Haloquadratum walsbyi]
MTQCERTRGPDSRCPPRAARPNRTHRVPRLRDGAHDDPTRLLSPRRRCCRRKRCRSRRIRRRGSRLLDELRETVEWLRTELGVNAFLAVDPAIPTETHPEETDQERMNVISQSKAYAEASNAVVCPPEGGRPRWC